VCSRGKADAKKAALRKPEEVDSVLRIRRVLPARRNWSHQGRRIEVVNDKKRSVLKIIADSVDQRKQTVELDGDNAARACRHTSRFYFGDERGAIRDRQIDADAKEIAHVRR